MEKAKDAQIIELLEANMIMSVKELSEDIECSEMTIRRYLDTLEESGLVTRKHGCAYLCQDAKPTKFDEQKNIHTREKFLIAHAASRLIKQDDVVCFDSGTSIHRMVRLLDNQMNFTAVTPSLPMLTDLGEYYNAKVLSLEGELNHYNLTIVLNSNGLSRSIDADISFISCRSLRLPVGTYEHTNDLVETKRWLAKQGKKRILLADSSKWQQSSICRCLPLRDIDVIITDGGVPRDQVKLAESLGIEVMVVSD